MAEDGEKAAAGKDGGATKPAESPWPGLIKSAGEKLLTVVLTTAGLVGFVAFAGSIALWTRFDALHLPSEQGIDAVPQGEAVAIGSVMLFAFGFFGALAVIAVYLIDRGGRATPGMSRGLLLIVALEGAFAIWFVTDGSVERKVLATEVLALVVGAILWTTYVGGLTRLKRDLPDFEGPELQQWSENTPFRRSTGRSEVSHRAVTDTVTLAAILGAAVGLLAAHVVAEASTPVAWALGLGAGALTLLVAVAMHYRNFARRGKEVRDVEDRREAQIAAADEDRRKPIAEKAARGKRRRACWRARLREFFSGGLTASWKDDGSPVSVSVSWPAGERAEAKQGQADRKEAKPRRKPPRVELAPSGAVLVGSLAIVMIAVPAAILGEWWLVVPLGGLVALGAGLWRVAGLSKERFIWYGLGVFISVPLFATVTLVSQNIADPQAQPMALLRTVDGSVEAIQGIYVTETDQRVYFASVATEGCGKDVIDDSGRLSWVPKKEVTAMSIGPLQDVDDAGRAALEMAYALAPSANSPAGEPAVRPGFGRGMRLKPEVASPGEEVELLMTTPNPDLGGFGAEPRGRTLRLNGVRLRVVEKGERNGGRPDYEWGNRSILFRVPDNATSGVVTIECGQLGGLPYLTVAKAPQARVSVRMRAGSERVVFDSSRSTDEDGELRSRSWTIAGRRVGDREKVSASLKSRIDAYAVRFTVTDADGKTDTVKLRLLRLPESRFVFGSDEPRDRRKVKQVKKAVRESVGDAKPVAIELHGHADAVGAEPINLELSMKRAERMRRELFEARSAAGASGAENASAGTAANLSIAIPLTVRAFGETCPIVPTTSREAANRRVEVFILGQGATVATPKSCRSGQVKRIGW